MRDFFEKRILRIYTDGSFDKVQKSESIKRFCGGAAIFPFDCLNRAIEVIVPNEINEQMITNSVAEMAAIWAAIKTVCKELTYLRNRIELAEKLSDK